MKAEADETLTSINRDLSNVPFIDIVAVDGSFMEIVCAGITLANAFRSLYHIPSTNQRKALA